jgi:hypothetical protein
MKCDYIWRIAMSTITYKVVKHDGGWAYEANGTYSEPFPTRDSARKAAKLAASEQAAPGETTQISYEDEKGRWHNEVDSGTERPKLQLKVDDDRPDLTRQYVSNCAAQHVTLLIAFLDRYPVPPAP